jgi:hypothetical protein
MAQCCCETQKNLIVAPDSRHDATRFQLKVGDSLIAVAPPIESPRPDGELPSEQVSQAGRLGARDECDEGDEMPVLQER